MKRFGLLFTCILAVSVFSFGQFALSQVGGGLVIAPKRVVFDKNQKVIEILLANRGGSEKRYRISIANRAMQENGQLKEVDTPAEGEFFAKDYVRYSPRQITLGPKETQKIRIMSRLKGDSADGEYRSHLVVQELPDPKAAEAAAQAAEDGLSINVQAIFGISIPVIMRKGDLSAEAELSAPKIKKIGEDTYLEMAVNRSGNKSFMGTANVFADSQKIGMLKNISVYMSTNRRIVSIKLDPDYAGSLSGKNIRVTFGAQEENEDAPEAEVSFVAP